MPPTPARFSFIYRPGHSRLYACYAWLLFMAATAHFWLGWLGIGLVCVLGTRWLRAQRGRLHAAAVVMLKQEELHQVWSLPVVICVELRDRRRCWWFRDEMPPATWSGLRRFLRLYLPRQALGLSMSR